MLHEHRIASLEARRVGCGKERVTREAKWSAERVVSARRERVTIWPEDRVVPREQRDFRELIGANIGNRPTLSAHALHGNNRSKEGNCIADERVARLEEVGKARIKHARKRMSKCIDRRKLIVRCEWDSKSTTEIKQCGKNARAIRNHVGDFAEMRRELNERLDVVHLRSDMRVQSSNAQRAQRCDGLDDFLCGNAKFPRLFRMRREVTPRFAFSIANVDRRIDAYKELSERRRVAGLVRGSRVFVECREELARVSNNGAACDEQLPRGQKVCGG